MALDNISYSWQFNPLTCYPTASGHTDVVATATYYLTATTTGSEFGQIFVTAGGKQDFSLPSDSGSFIPFEELTIPIVAEWVEAALGEESLNRLKADLEVQLDNKVNPKTEDRTSPWIYVPPIG